MNIKTYNLQYTYNCLMYNIICLVFTSTRSASYNNVVDLMNHLKVPIFFHRFERRTKLCVKCLNLEIVLQPYPSPVNRVDKTLTLTKTKRDSIQTLSSRFIIIRQMIKK